LFHCFFQRSFACSISLFNINAAFNIIFKEQNQLKMYCLPQKISVTHYLGATVDSHEISCFDGGDQVEEHV
jgi:hypothetical protein